MSSLIRTFAPNHSGRDFVLGDLHGCIGSLERLLRHLDFDPDRDRMFSVGDLIDRGPDSMACLRLLKEPWFHAVLGNHEDMMLNAVERGFGDAGSSVIAHWIANGGDWAIAPWRADNDEFAELAGLVAQLPLAILVAGADGRLAGVCHAEPPTGWNEDCLIRESQKILWGRQKINAPESARVNADVDWSVHGHTIRSEPQFCADACWVDLGCYLTGRLCAVQISGEGGGRPIAHLALTL